MEDFAKVIGGIVLGGALLAGIAFAFAYPTLWCVNYLFTASVLMAAFGVPALTFWKALWLNVLCGLLFKGSSSKQ